MSVITLTTDFGYRDGYVGAMKGVIARTVPAARLVDIAHDIPRGDVAHAAWVLRTSTLEFPADTVHVVVVDPGVGSERPAVYGRQRGRDQWYVGPDNGVFAYLDLHDVWAVDVKAMRGVSATFHGRDVFAPVAAQLAHDRKPNAQRTKLTGTLPWGSASCIVHIDHYGNLISNVDLARWRDAGSEWRDVQSVRIAGTIVPVVDTYSDVAPGELVAYVGSAHTIEVAVRDGRADTRLAVSRGEPITVSDGGAYR
jgi:S-adenosylmethionine hydrolase